MLRYAQKIMFFDDPKQLTNEQIREKLTALGYSSSLIESLIEVFWFYDPYQSFIAVPERFEVLLHFLEEKQPETFNRFNYYYYFFEKVVPGYSSLRDHLQQLRLYFEQVQQYKSRKKNLQNYWRVSVHHHSLLLIFSKD